MKLRSGSIYNEVAKAQRTLRSSHGSDRSADVAKQDGPFSLPLELWRRIIELLDVGDIKAMRISSRVWTNAGVEYMFKPFVFKAYRHDFDRFEEVSKYASMVSGIDTLRFETGAIDVTYLWRNLTSAYDPQFFWAHRDRCTLAELTEFNTNLHADLEEYASWNWDYRNCYYYYDNPTLLANVICKLVRLKKIEISSMACPFRSPRLIDAWDDIGENSHFAALNSQFISLLETLHTVLPAGKLKELSHDGLPITFFVQESPQKLLELTRPFRHLTSLQLTLTSATDAPLRLVWKTLSRVLETITDLHDLRLGCNTIDTGNFDYVWEDIDPASESNKDWYVSLQWIFRGCKWPNLEKFHLNGLLVCQPELQDILTSWKASLRVLWLENIGLWHQGYYSLLQGIRESLHLTDFRLWGIIRQFHGDNEQLEGTAFHKDTGCYSIQPLAEDIPERANNSAYQRFVTRYGSRNENDNVCLKFRDFVLGDGPWPSFRYLKDFSDDHEHSPSCSTLCEISKAQKVSVWESAEQDATAHPEWESSVYSSWINQYNETHETGGDVEVEAQRFERILKHGITHDEIFAQEPNMILGRNAEDVHWQRMFNVYGSEERLIETFVSNAIMIGLMERMHRASDDGKNPHSHTKSEIEVADMRECRVCTALGTNTLGTCEIFQNEKEC